MSSRPPDSQSAAAQGTPAQEPDTPPAAAPAVVARGLVKRYEEGRVRALDGVDLQIGRGEFVAICGPSGCGKTTLLNMISAIDRPDEGRLSVCGHDVGAFQDGQADVYRRGTIGLVFQLHNLLPLLTALENVQIPLLGTGLAPAERVDRAAALLRRVGLEPRQHARPPTLSGGERQRVAVCRALVNRPSLLLADEPTGALDSHSGEALFDLLAELRRDLGMTLIVVTHDAQVARRAERTIHMLDGRVRAPAG
jgi:putative ABC transport system ATP-binding protein